MYIGIHHFPPDIDKAFLDNPTAFYSALYQLLSLYVLVFLDYIFLCKMQSYKGRGILLLPLTILQVQQFDYGQILPLFMAMSSNHFN